MITDLSTWHGARPEGITTIRLAMFDGDGRSFPAVGAQRLCQKFVTLFFTRRGSIYGRPNQGTDFVQAFRQGRLSNAVEIQSQFALAASAALSVMAGDVGEDVVTAVKLESYSVVGGGLVLKARMEFEAGGDLVVFLPVSSAQETHP